MIPPPHADAAPGASEIVADARELVDQATHWLLTHWLQIAIAAAVGTIIVAALLGLRALGTRLCHRRARGVVHVTDLPTILCKAIARTRLWFMVALAARIVLVGTNPPATVLAAIVAAFTIASVVQAAIWARELILGAIEHRAGEDAEHGAVGSAMGIIRLLVTVTLVAIAAILILDNLGVNVTGLVAGLGIGGVAIGLAAQGIFADLFAALAIILDRPFHRGDSIRWEQTTGTVERIGIKSTRIRALSGEEIVIANKHLLDKELHNFARLDRRRMSYALGVVYETPLERLEAIPGIVREIVEATDKCSIVRCGFTGFGASSLDFELQLDVHSENYNEVFDTHGRVGLAILKAFGAAGIAFAYPTQTSYAGERTEPPA